ncbi:MAG TPA: 50S ribosomal protein L11 methyltransferase [Candidatus Sulfotelmatobacter sp.]|jgi:methylase of polypeptide subunit release factors|nr:50S ribosomal protein L11 methyltransferase [Candidatus Sulfotelmatobacter sp.]
MKGIPKVPYFQTSRYRVETMVELAEIKPGEKGADLGSGDGRIVIAFAKAGVEMHGYEIDDSLRKISEENIRNANLSNAFIHTLDFWQEDLSQYDIICCYPMPTIMGRLEHKLQEELEPGTRILLNYFPFKHWNEKKIKDNVFLYSK